MKDQEQKLKDLIFSGEEANQKLAVQLAKSQGVCISDIIAEYCMRCFDDDKVLQTAKEAIDDPLHGYNELIYDFDFLNINTCIYHLDSYQVLLTSRVLGTPKYNYRKTIVFTACMDALNEVAMVELMSKIKSSLEYFIKNRFLDTVMEL